MPETYWLLINRVLTQGRMSNSYKPALLRALADYGASGRNELRVSWEWLAERFVIYYWPLAIRHRVRQATDPVKEPVVVRLIKELEVKSTMTADQFRQRDANQFENLIERLVQPGTTSGGHHTPTFKADDASLEVGIRVMSTLLVEYLAGGIEAWSLTVDPDVPRY